MLDLRTMEPADPAADAAKQPKPMSDETLNAIIDAELTDAIRANSSSKSQHSRDLAKAIDAYMNAPLGDERPGRSAVQTSDVQDTVESILPSLLKIFFSGDEIVKYQPRQPGDEAMAQQATDYINFIITNDNNGFLSFYDWFKDALLQRNGYVMPYWKMEDRTVMDMHTGLDDNALAFLLQDGVELLEANAYPDASVPPQIDPMTGVPLPQPMLYDVRIRRTVKEGRIDLLNIPPEYAIISRGSKDIDTARLSGYRCRKTISDLLEEGFDPALLDTLTPCDDYIGNSEEEIARWRDEDGHGSASVNADTTDRSRVEVWVTVLFIRVDYDGDGKSELRMITRAGESEGGTILANVEVDANDMCSLTPIPMPHKHFGRSVADLVLEIQAVKTAILRQMLDSIYVTVNPRHKVVKGMGVDIEALINPVPNGYVMMDTLDATEPFDQQQLPSDTFKMLEYQDSVRETRTGVTRYNQGLDADSLNKTATGISMIQGASQQRLELIARIFAETGIVKLFRSLLRLTIKHQDKARVVRLRDEWVEFDPRSWNADMDVSISVGLGAGSREAVMSQSMMLLQVQQQLAQTSAMMGAPIVTPENLYNNAIKIAEAAGHKDGDQYFTHPQVALQQQMQQAQMMAMMGIPPMAPPGAPPPNGPQPQPGPPQ